ncbi:MAG TPA: addiction module protein [Gammaproteobacteria bacterium]|nr:addiction module protein [Gammaproteobacteria bacterium]
MSTEAEKVLEQALHLQPHERAVVAEGLLSSINRLDPEIDAVWAAEAEARIDAEERGEMETVPADEVFAKYEQH